MPDILALLPDTFSPVLVAVGALLAFAESAFGLGVLVPGELGVLVLGATASTPVQVVLALTVVTLAASAADHVGYLIGRRYGRSLRDSRVVRRVGTDSWDRAAELLRRRGPLALVVSRLLPLVRTVVPAAAGAARMRYRRFVAGSVVGSALWACLWLGGGALAGQALPRVADRMGSAGWIVLAGIVLVCGLLVLRRRARQRRRAAAAPQEWELELV
ncbi:DedA family protein [uncultured Georgenia sp.]|uniref:DedA family protein n=1 Tax=uncultured Georgenia sp. TaxID=378209 RepID=UPI002630C7BB|nr:DedA family protein [uncultured Georgenia sp.]HLV04116.1 DedA family protein [Actinomycetaceae bacterium]